MKRCSFPLVLLLLPILTGLILQSNALAPYSFTVSSSGTINYNPTPDDGWLHTDGIYVKDSQSRIVALRQIFCMAWSQVTEQFIVNAKSHGLNVINMAFQWQGYVDPIIPLCSFDPTPNSADFVTLDQKINLCKKHGVYTSLTYLEATTEMYNDWGMNKDAVINFLIQKWTPILERYKNESTLIGIHPIDEPNYSGAEELDMWTKVIGALRQINPNLLWFTHTITVLRMGEQYWGSIPWKTPTEVPYPNIIMDAGFWVSVNHPELGQNFGPTDYAAADTVFNSVIAMMKHFRDNVQIPTGLTPGIDEYYPANNARTYLLTKLYRWMEVNRYIVNHYIIDYQTRWGYEDGLPCFQELFPDTPYPNYW